MTTESEQNKQAAQDFYDLMFNQCRPREAIEKVIPETSKHDNTMF